MSTLKKIVEAEKTRKRIIEEAYLNREEELKLVDIYIQNEKDKSQLMLRQTLDTIDLDLNAQIRMIDEEYGVEVQKIEDNTRNKVEKEKEKILVELIKEITSL